MPDKKIWFQKLFYKESVLAIKSSLDFLNFDSFKNDLVRLLPQESKSSRVRIANNILKRFFPDKKIFGMMPQAFQVYRDETLLQELIRFEFLSKEPVIANFYLEYVHPEKYGKIIQSSEFSEYIKKVYGSKNENLTWWLQGALRDLGFINKSNNFWKISPVNPPETALILLFHYLFANQPVLIDFSHIEEENFWKLIGIKSIAELKNILFKAHLLNIIEFKNGTIKTIFPVDVLINQKFKLE